MLNNNKAHVYHGCNSGAKGKKFRAKGVPCPNCGFRRLIDARDGIKSQTFLPDEDGYSDADYFQKCSNCKKEIGIKKIQ